MIEMKLEDAARAVRQIYLDRGINLSMYLEKELPMDIDIKEIFPRETLHLFDQYRDSPEGGLSFSEGFDFEKSNRQRRQILYLQEKAAELIREAAPEKILSLGIGDGVTAAKYAGHATFVTGIDMHAEFLAKARSSIPGLVRVQADLESPLPLPDASFDAAECIMVSHHIRRFRELISEAARMLRPGGIFILGDICDMTLASGNMTFPEAHMHPPFHGIEFYRSHSRMMEELSVFFDQYFYERVCPSLVLIGGKRHGQHR